MGEDFFEYLPPEVIVNILSRLPTRAAVVCKCVCKPWLGLLATPEFVNPHMSRSVPGLAVETHSNSFEIVEFVDELETELFSTFSVPPPCGIGSRDCKTPSVLRGCLCVSHITADGEIVIWLMMEYGDEKSWAKEIVICRINLSRAHRRLQRRRSQVPPSPPHSNIRGYYIKMGNSKLGEDFFEYLPSDIIVNIISRLPIQDAMACKCVCKPWLVLLATPEFVNSHLSRSVPGIAIETHPKSYDVMEIVDELCNEECHPYTAFNFKLPFDEPIHSSANGLIFLRGVDHGDLILCNPVTRDYIKLPSPRQTTSRDQLAWSFGFGVSKTTGQFKVVRIFLEKPLHGEYKKPRHEYKNESQVYTVGTGMWRKVPHGSRHCFLDRLGGLLFNGNLHWRVIEKIGDDLVEWISCLDLETERFSTFAVPCIPDIEPYIIKTLCVLRDCLCLCYKTATNFRELAIWSMKEYGNEKSWTKEVLTGEAFGGYSVLHAFPFKVFENGDILMECDRENLCYYSNKTKTYYDFFIREDCNEYISTTMYTPSFLTLKNFVMENVSSF
ncbi:F-box protein CPR1-like [Salvia splendens]|uniref:F-box protein CPR1-like n=1 Tax=Salvia splendens TaxID=180675 RepID=UPI001C263E70|nr:F-box protein CPR1-like [Salvia splendens]